MTVLLVFAGGMVGAPARYLLDRAVRARAGDRFPWGILAANVLGSLILGALLGAAAPARVTLLLGTGVCGALTTFSTLGHDTVRLLERGRPARAAANALGSLLLGLAAAAAAFTTASWLTGA